MEIQTILGSALSDITEGRNAKGSPFGGPLGTTTVSSAGNRVQESSGKLRGNSTPTCFNYYLHDGKVKNQTHNKREAKSADIFVYN